MSLKLKNVLQECGEKKASLMAKTVSLDNIIRAFPYHSIRLDKPERVVRGAFLGMKLVQ